MNEQQRYHAVLWVNDTPDEYRGNGASSFSDGPYPHGHIYYAENHRPEIAVSFDAMDGTAVRVKFDPVTGKVETEDITAAQR